ncbi:hypothetical protein TCAL_17116 [Tigriopus californicus]|uniref:Uncharacterized protein n=1 Tax=Tigriopus californicus TaxID=6832 RepID=A0A553P4X7_TIGCA|nr:hypothetical protein TCAL_17116 [Tigriopus californicus]
MSQKNLATFRPTSMWQPSSPDYRPLDYAMMDGIKINAFAILHPNVVFLKGGKESNMSNDSRLERPCTDVTVGLAPRFRGDFSNEGAD